VERKPVIVSPGSRSRAELLTLLEAQGYRVAHVDELGAARRLLEDDSVELLVLDPAALAAAPDQGTRDEATPERAVLLGVGIEHAPIPTAIFDAQMRYLAVSRSWAAAFRVEDQVLVGRAHTEVFPELPQRWRDLQDRALAGEVLRSDGDPITRADGTVDWIRWELRPWFREPGTIAGIVVYAQIITEHRDTEQALRDSEAHLRHIADAVPHPIWELSPSGALSYANRATHEYFGVASLADVHWRDCVHPDDLANAAVLFGPALAAETGGPLPPLRMRRHDGAYRWFAHHATAVRDEAGQLRYVVGSSTDIHELKHTRDALDESQRRLVTALAAARMGTWRWDIDANSVTVDPSLAQLLGRAMTDFEGLDMSAAVAAAIHPDDHSAIQAAFQAVVAEGLGAEVSGEWRIVRPGGEVVWLRTHGRVELDPRDGHRVLAGACVDVTRSKALEAKLQQAQKMEAIGLLAGGIAHDFNNILTVVLGHASMIEVDPRLAPELVGSVREIVVAAEQAAELTNQLLAFGRRQVLERRDLDLNLVVAELVDLFRRLLGPEISCEFTPAPAPVMVHADRGMVTQVLLNLVVNARDAMPRGGRLDIRARIDGCDQVGRAWSQLEVVDTGSGIAPEVLPHIFEPFYTTKQVGQGTGLGLATVYGIIEQHGGRLTVDSELGRGTRFLVSLPRTRD
jgi:two-component system, cell cycle sensor histidine kinase and response regulator CckA